MARGVVRTAISLEPEVLVALDRWVRQRNSRSRSEAIRFLVRGATSATSLADPNADAVGTVMVLYDHRSPYVQRRLTAAQHRWGDHIRSSSHVHLEGDLCLEVMILVGHRREVEQAAEDLRGVKGVSQGDFLVASPRVAGGRTGHHHPHAHHRPRSGRGRSVSG
ncbi:MAG TPA: nickel-responsive transcriptional regulator NikR [Thermoplasmata archaeon]|nr:nickel-responsive transcriptional regulator NikR [Thermoplasmata archaeon]